MESGKKVVLEKVVSKGSIISAKLKKKNEYNHKQAEKVREKLDSRFEKNRSQRSMVEDEIKLAENPVIKPLTKEQRNAYLEKARELLSKGGGVKIIK
jgi:ribosomal protein S20